MSDLRLDSRLRDLLPPLSVAERDGLEEDIVRRGCLAPIVTMADGTIVDGHHRYEICRKRGVDFGTAVQDFRDVEDAMLWAVRHQENRRNLTTYQRAEVAMKLKPVIAARAKERQGTRTDLNDGNIPAMLPESSVGETRDELATIAGLGARTFDKAEFLDQHADDATKRKLRSGETTINAEFVRVRKENARSERETAKAAEIVVPTDERVRIHVVDIAEAAKFVEAASVDFIVTDPPYPKEYLHVYQQLAAFSAHALRPGGSLLCMIGQSYLPEIVAAMSRVDGLAYQWTLAYLTPGGQATQLWDRKVNTFWKPVLWFVRGTYGSHWVGDVARSEVNDNDKNHHHWGQSASGMFDLIDRFVVPNQTVCDPFLGGGTTGIAALQAGCSFIGLDRDESCTTRSEARFAEFLKNQEISHES